MDVVAAVEGIVLSFGTSPWILLVVAALAAVDGFFPPVPSESVVIAVAVLAATGDGPNPWALVAAAAAGAFAGDVLAYSIGSRIPVDELWLFRGRRGRAVLQSSRLALARQGGVFVVAGRFVPIGRVAVNMTAGAVGYPRARFLAVAAVAATVWAGYSVLIGVLAGQVLHDRPLMAVAIGVLGGVVAGLALERVSRSRTRPIEPAGLDGRAVEPGVRAGV